MKVIVNDIAASQGGAISVLMSFYDYICRYENDIEWIFLLSDHYIEERNNIRVITVPSVKKNGINKLLFDFIYGRIKINEMKPDYVLSLQNTYTFGVKAPQGIYIHQSIPFQTVKKFSFLRKDERTEAKYQYLIGKIITLSLKFAKDVYVQTEWMKESVSEKSGKDKNSIIVVPISADPYYQSDAEMIDFNCCSFIYPTLSREKYKNCECIECACNILDEMNVQEKGILNYQVKVTSSTGKEFANKHMYEVEKMNQSQLLRAYKESTIIFPSYIETVGLPLLEGRMAQGMILAADCPYAHESLKDYKNAYYFDPFKPQELARLMYDIIQGKITRKEDSERCLGEKMKGTNTWETVTKQIKSGFCG